MGGRKICESVQDFEWVERKDVLRGGWRSLLLGYFIFGKGSFILIRQSQETLKSVVSGSVVKQYSIFSACKSSSL